MIREQRAAKQPAYVTEWMNRRVELGGEKGIVTDVRMVSLDGERVILLTAPLDGSGLLRGRVDARTVSKL